VGRASGVTEEQIKDLLVYRESGAFSPLEKLALDYAVAMTRTPVEVSDDLVAALREQLSDSAIVELTASIAWENHRARFNHALGIEAQGFSEGAACALPERQPAGTHVAVARTD
jgi:4-carboxymuconolactone decarboxylase